MKDLEIFKLEGRILFEAAAVAEIVDAADAASQEHDPGEADTEKQNLDAVDNVPFENNETVSQLPEMLPSQVSDIDAELNALIEGVTPAETTAEPAEELIPAILADQGENITVGKELVVLNNSLPDKDSILAKLQPDQDVLILSDNNGLVELNDYLSRQDQVYSAIHFITHGNDGEIVINGELLTNQTFHAAEWSELGTHLTADGDILFYGCKTAETPEGKLLIDQIAEATDADIAASTDVTGVSGDWDLEYRAGVVETVEISADDYRFDLAAVTVSNFNELKDALEDAGLNGGNVTITISADITVENSIYIDIYEDLILTIQGVDDTIDLFGKELEDIFWFEDIFADKNVIVTIDQLNFDGGQNQQAYTAIIANGVESLTISDVTLENFTDAALKMSGTGNEWLVVENSEFLNNSTSSDGGAIHASYISVTINNSYFAGNRSAQSGGALELQNIQNLSISNTTFSLNTSENYGGAVHIVTAPNAVVDITNSTFYGNKATDAVATGGGGGAIYIEHSDDTATVTISNSTFANNETDPNGLGSAIGNSNGNIAIKNTLLIGSGDSVVVQENGGTMTLTRTLATSSDGDVKLEDGAEVNSEFTFDNVFGCNPSYDKDTHTIAPDAFHKAAYSGTLIGTLDQRGINRDSINTALGFTGMYYSIGAVTAKPGIIVKQGNYSTTYTGSAITPEDHTSIVYADGTTVNSITVSSVTLTSDTTPIINKGTYTITPDKDNLVLSGIDPAKVLIKTESGTLTVDPAKLNITVSGKKVYDGTNSMDGSTFKYNVTGEASSAFNESWITVTDFTYNSKNVEGVKSAFGNIDLSTEASNFEINSVSYQGEITPRAIEITANSSTVTYDGTNQVLQGATVTSGSLATGDSLIVDARVSGRNVNNTGYTYTLDASGIRIVDGSSGDMEVNYTITYNTGLLTITPLSITITASQADIVYGAAVAPTYTPSTTLGTGDSFTGALSVTGEKSTSGNWIVGSHMVQQGTLAINDGNGGKNYTITFNEDSFEVSARGVTVANITVNDKVFDGNTNATVDTSSATFTVMITGDNLSVSTTGSFSDLNAGTDKVVTLGALTLGGSDAANYYIAGSQSQATADITAKPVEITFVTDAPYIYNGKDQSNTISATYIDINGNVVEVALDFGGKEFKDAGVYTVTAVGTDPNYALTNNTITLVIDPAEPTVVYCEGLYPGYYSAVASMQADLESKYPFGVPDDNIYTMTYPELVSKTMLGHNTEINRYSGDNIYDSLNGFTVTVDTLKHHPFAIEGIAQEISSGITAGGNVIHESGIYSGNELFPESGDEEHIQLFGLRGQELSDEHNPVFLEKGHHEEFNHAEDYYLRPEIVHVPASVFQKPAGLEESIDVLPVNGQNCSKSSNFKSPLEKLLDQLCLA